MLISLHFYLRYLPPGFGEEEREPACGSVGSRKKVGILAVYFVLVFCYNSFGFRSLSITNARPLMFTVKLRPLGAQKFEALGLTIYQ